VRRRPVTDGAVGTVRATTITGLVLNLAFYGLVFVFSLLALLRGEPHTSRAALPALLIPIGIGATRPSASGDGPRTRCPASSRSRRGS
jgi:hypothetical protein